MSGLPRTGLFSRSHINSITNRNRTINITTNSKDNEKFNLNSGSNEIENDANNSGNISMDNLKQSTSNVESPASSSFVSLPRDQEGFDDLDAYFNRAVTPQKTPKSLKKLQSDAQAPSNSKLATPSNHRKTSSVLVAKPLKMISSKIAEHYKKEPRMAVSMSAVEAEKEEKRIRFNEEKEKEKEIVANEELKLASNEELKLTANDQNRSEQTFVNMMEMDMNMDMNMNININMNMNNMNMDNNDHTILDEITDDNQAQDHELPDERVSRAKRELEEMSITSYDQTDETLNNSIVNGPDEVHLSKYIKNINIDTLNTLNFKSNEEYSHNQNNDQNQNQIHSHSHSQSHDSSNNCYYANDEVPDDVLMDRLVEEMLVSHDDHEYEEVTINNITTANNEESDLDKTDESSNDSNSFSVNNTQGSVKQTISAAITDPEVITPKKEKDLKPKSKSRARSTGARNVSGLSRRNMNYFPGAEINESGQRRGCRVKMEPLRYWANEKVCYGRAEDPSITLPVIVQVIKKPELDDPTFAMGLTRKRRRNPSSSDGNANKLRAQAYGPECDVEAVVQGYERPGEEEMRLIALSHHHVQGDPVKDCSFRIHTIFTEGSYMSSGQLIFPPASQKPTKNSARHALVFYVIAGSFRVEINRTSLVIGPGGQFHVPRANHYTITHISADKTVEGKLFFCHCKDNSEYS